MSSTSPKLLATYTISIGNRHYTDTTYKWWDDGDVEISIITGDDDWDSYNGPNSEEKKIVQFDSLPDDIKKALNQKLELELTKEKERLAKEKFLTPKLKKYFKE